MSKVLYLLTGPTAVGKTRIALQWAKMNNAEILSCDSLLFYQGMDVGTAKPTKEEQLEVPHHGIDIQPVDQQFNIKAYIDFAKEVVESVYSRGRKLLITGGSGFYLKAFLRPVTDDIEIPKEVNQSVLALYEDKGLDGLITELRKLNPKGNGDLDILNPRRVIKALARCRASGESLLGLKESFKMQKSPFEKCIKKVSILDRNPESLKKRIRQRVLEMIKLGLIEEVQQLIEQGMQKNPSAASAIGYRETIDWLKRGGGNKQDLVEAIILNTNKLVAKQRKWFRTQIEDARIINLDKHLGMEEELFID